MTDAILNPIFDMLHAKNVACWGVQEESTHLPPHHLPVRRLWSQCSQGKSRLPLEVGRAGPRVRCERGSPRLIPAWALRPQEKLVLLVVREEGGAPRFRPRPSPSPVLSRTNQPTQLPVFRGRLFSFTAAKWRTCWLSVANRKGLSKTKILELSGRALAVCIRC